MKLIFLLAFLPLVLCAEYRRHAYPFHETQIKHNQDYQPPQADSENLSHIVKSWLSADLSLHKVSEKFVQTLLPYAFTLFTESDLTSDCAKDMVNFLKGVAETKLWAFQMADSFGKVPVGIIGGTMSSLGDYETCLNASNNDLFFGKYCLLDIEIPLPEQRDFHIWKQDIGKIFDLTHNDTVMHEFLKYEEKIYMMHPRTSICLPSTCTIDDAQHLSRKMFQMAGLQFNVNIKSCETKQDRYIEATFLDYLSMLLLLSLILVVGTATVIDFFERVTSDISDREEGLSPLLSFSIFINTERLVKKDDNPNSIKVFHGMRVITMVWLISAHVGLVDHLEAYGGLKRYFEICSSFWGQLQMSGLIAVETFFFMSGTLLSYNILKATEQKITISLVLLKRYIRTTVPHLMMIAVTCILAFVGTGPLFKKIIGKEAQNCKERGWMNLLYINNYIPFSDICMANTWYLSVDFQLFFIALLIIIPLRNYPRTAIVSIVALMFVGIIGTIVSHILYNLPPTYLAIDPQLEYISNLFQKSYLLPHFHLPTYCIGLLVGYFLALRNHIRVSLKINIILWITTISVQFALVFGTYFWNNSNEFPGLLPSVLYGCSHRVLWALSLAWITISCQSNLGGVAGKFLGSERFVLLSRLTFMAYLINFTIKYLYIGTTANVIIFSLNSIYNILLSILSATFIGSFVLTLLFEAPFMNLEKALMTNLLERKAGKGK